MKAATRRVFQPLPRGRHSMSAPAPRRKNGRSQRPEPKFGRTTVRAQFVRVPCSAGRRSMMAVTMPSTSRVSPTSERMTSGGSWTFGKSNADRRRVRVVRRTAGRRRAATSDLHDDGEDHRPSLRLLEQVTRYRVLDLGLQQGDLAQVLTGCLDRLDDPSDGGLDDRVALIGGHEAAGDDLRAADDTPGL